MVVAPAASTSLTEHSVTGPASGVNEQCAHRQTANTSGHSWAPCPDIPMPSVELSPGCLRSATCESRFLDVPQRAEYGCSHMAPCRFAHAQSGKPIGPCEWARAGEHPHAREPCPGYERP